MGEGDSNPFEKFALFSPMAHPAYNRHRGIRFKSVIFPIGLQKCHNIFENILREFNKMTIIIIISELRCFPLNRGGKKNNAIRLCSTAANERHPFTFRSIIVLFFFFIFIF